MGWQPCTVWLLLYGLAPPVRVGHFPGTRSPGTSSPVRGVPLVSPPYRAPVLVEGWLPSGGMASNVPGMAPHVPGMAPPQGRGPPLSANQPCTSRTQMAILASQARSRPRTVEASLAGPSMPIHSGHRTTGSPSNSKSPPGPDESSPSGPRCPAPTPLRAASTRPRGPRLTCPSSWVGEQARPQPRRRDSAMSVGPVCRVRPIAHNSPRCLSIWSMRRAQQWCWWGAVLVWASPRIAPPGQHLLSSITSMLHCTWGPYPRGAALYRSLRCEKGGMPPPPEPETRTRDEHKEPNSRRGRTQQGWPRRREPAQDGHSAPPTQEPIA